jgi:hypothetical protein
MRENRTYGLTRGQRRRSSPSRSTLHFLLLFDLAKSKRKIAQKLIVCEKGFDRRNLT